MISMGRWKNAWMDGCIKMHESMDGCKNAWMDEWMKNTRINEWMENTSG